MRLGDETLAREILFGAARDSARDNVSSIFSEPSRFSFKGGKGTGFHFQGWDE